MINKVVGVFLYEFLFGKYFDFMCFYWNLFFKMFFLRYVILFRRV